MPCLPTSELESQQEPQDIKIQICSKHSKDNISHSNEADTTHKPSNYELNIGRTKKNT